MVTDVPAGPAADAGIKAGDVITSFAGGPVKDTRDLVRRVADAPVGNAVDVMVLRDGKPVTLQVTLGRRELADADGTGQPGGNDQPGAPGQVLGMTLAPLTPELAARLQVPEGTPGPRWRRARGLRCRQRQEPRRPVPSGQGRWCLRARVRVRSRERGSSPGRGSVRRAPARRRRQAAPPQAGQPGRRMRCEPFMILSAERGCPVTMRPAPCQRPDRHLCVERRAPVQGAENKAGNASDCPVPRPSLSDRRSYCRRR